MSRKSSVASGLLTGRPRVSVPGRRKLRQVAGCAVVLTGVFSMGQPGASALSNPLPAEARLDFMSTDDGLTRESIAAISRPETAHPAPSSKGTVNGAPGNGETPDRPVVTRRRRHLLVATTNRHHRRWRHRQIARREDTATPPPAPPPTPPRRGVVVRFVTWWNGLVIRNFHTRFGTVKLDSWGADT